jgi:hypothetical protein
MSKLLRPMSASDYTISPLTLPKPACNREQIVFIKVDELDEKPRLLRRLSDPTPRKLLHICDNTGCSTIDKEMKLCAGCQYNRYCSEDCQKQDWWHHKDVCKHTCVSCKKVFAEFAKTEKVKYKSKRWTWNFCEKCESEMNQKDDSQE